MLVVLAALLALGSFAAGAAAQESAPQEKALPLVSQTSWVGENGAFAVTVSTTGLPSGATLRGELYGAVPDRAALAESIRGERLGTVKFRTQAKPLATLDPFGTGTATITLQVTTSPTSAVDTVQLSASPSVRPYAVRAYDADDVEIASVITHLVRLAPPTTADATTPLSVNTVVPLTADVTVDDAGQPRLDAPAARRLEDTMAVLTARAGLPLTVVPSAESIRLLVDDGGGRDAVESLGARATTATLAGPYAPIDTGAWVAADLSDQMKDQYTAGAETVSDLLDDQPDGRVAVLDRTVTPAALARLLELGVESVIVPSDQLTPLNPATDPVFASRFALDADPAVAPHAIVADSPTASRLEPGGDPVLAGHQALAELSVLQLGQGNGDHGVAVVVPAGVEPTALTTFLDGLADNAGVVGSGSAGTRSSNAVSLEAFQNDVREATMKADGRTVTLTRGYTSDAPADLGSYPTDLRAAERSFAGLSSLVADNQDITEPVERPCCSRQGRGTSTTTAARPCSTRPRPPRRQSPTRSSSPPRRW